MTVLCSYIFPSASALSGITVRAFACGRYLNNSGGSLTPSISASYNGTVLATRSFTVASSAVAKAWRVWAHFYLSTTIQAAGIQPGIGAALEAGMTNAFAVTGIDGGYYSDNTLVLSSNPYATFINQAQQTTLELDFVTLGSDALELHTGYMEAL